MALPDTVDLPQDSRITSRWKLDESSGSRVDSVGSNDLTNNSVGSGSGNNSATCADFESSSNSYLSIGDGSHSGLDITGDLTISLWVNFESVSANMSFVTKYKTSPDSKSYLFAWTTGSGLYLNLSSDGSTSNTKTVAWSPSTGVWYHAVVTYSATTQEVNFYIDGSQQGSTQTGAPSSIYNGTADFRIGSWDASGSPAWLLDGLAEDAVIWPWELTSAEVSDLYDAYTNQLSLVNIERRPIRGVMRGCMRP